MAALEELFAQLQGLVSADPPQHQAALPVVEKSGCHLQRSGAACFYRDLIAVRSSVPICGCFYPSSAGEMKKSCPAPVLAQAPEDADALKCKLVALINLKRFDQAIAVFATVPSLSSSCAWEKAYSQYRLNCHAEALEVLEAAAPKKGVDVRMDLLRAQVLYRLGRYHDCGEVYGALEDDDTDPVCILLLLRRRLCCLLRRRSHFLRFLRRCLLLLRRRRLILLPNTLPAATL